MADPTRGKVIGVTVTNGVAGNEVKIVNLSRVVAAETIVLSSGKDASYNTANSGVAWQAGDVLQVQSTGTINQTKQVILSGGGVNVVLGDSADTDTPAVDL